MSVEVQRSVTHLLRADKQHPDQLFNKHGCGLVDQPTDRNDNLVSSFVTTFAVCGRTNCGIVVALVNVAMSAGQNLARKP